MNKWLRFKLSIVVDVIAIIGLISLDIPMETGVSMAILMLGSLLGTLVMGALILDSIREVWVLSFLITLGGGAVIGVTWAIKIMTTFLA